MENLKVIDVRPNYLKDFLLYLSNTKGRSNNTLISYYNDLKMFFRYLKLSNNLSNCEFDGISIEDLDDSYVKAVTLNTAMEFLYYMASERKNSPKARARRAVTLRRFYKYLTDIKMWFSISPMEKLELPSPKTYLPKNLTLQQAVSLLKTYTTTANVQNARDFCVLTFFLNCGMRLSELVGLNISDIKSFNDPNTDELVYTMKVLGKGNKERILYLNDACIKSYNIYLEYRMTLAEEIPSLKGEKALFLSRLHRRISNRRVQQIVELALKANNLDNMGFSVHKLRHTAATLMYQSGVDVRALKEVLGHESLETTQIYTHVANEQIRAAINSNPLNKL